MAVRVGFIAEYDGDYFQIVRVVKSISDGIMMAAVTGEHISYVLNDKRYALDSFDFEGAPADGLGSSLAFIMTTVSPELTRRNEQSLIR